MTSVGTLCVVCSSTELFLRRLRGGTAFRMFAGGVADPLLSGCCVTLLRFVNRGVCEVAFAGLSVQGRIYTLNILAFSSGGSSVLRSSNRTRDWRKLGDLLHFPLYLATGHRHEVFPTSTILLGARRAKRELPRRQHRSEKLKLTATRERIVLTNARAKPHAETCSTTQPHCRQMLLEIDIVFCFAKEPAHPV